MMPAPNANLPPEQLDELSAYLDGELSAESAARVEQWLARDPAARTELERLERSWRLLDELPQSAASHDFARTTVAMVALAAEEDVASFTAALPVVRRRRWVGIGLGAVLAGCLGFVTYKMAAPNPNDQLLKDLSIIEHLDEYRQVGDIEFLRLLRDEHLFVEEASE